MTTPPPDPTHANIREPRDFMPLFLLVKDEEGRVVSVQHPDPWNPLPGLRIKQVGEFEFQVSYMLTLPRDSWKRLGAC